jgi:hypothetical protein
MSWQKHEAEEAVHFMMARNQSREEEEGPEPQYPLLGHAPDE